MTHRDMQKRMEKACTSQWNGRHQGTVPSRGEGIGLYIWSHETVTGGSQVQTRPGSSTETNGHKPPSITPETFYNNDQLQKKKWFSRLEFHWAYKLPLREAACQLIDGQHILTPC